MHCSDPTRDWIGAPDPTQPFPVWPQSTSFDRNGQCSVHRQKGNFAQEALPRRGTSHERGPRKKTRKTSAPVSLVDLGCWAPSESSKSVKQASYLASERPMIGPGHGTAPENRSSSKGPLRLHKMYPSASAVQAEISHHRKTYRKSIPNLSAYNQTPTDWHGKSSPSCKCPHQHSACDKSRQKQQHVVKELQAAVSRLSTKLKSMDLDALLLPQPPPEHLGEKCSNHDAHMVHKSRLHKTASSRLELTDTTQPETNSAHGLNIERWKTKGAATWHRGCQHRRRMVSSHQLALHSSCQFEEADGCRGRTQNQDAHYLSQICVAQVDIQTPENVDIEFLGMNIPAKENTKELKQLRNPGEGVGMMDKLGGPVMENNGRPAMDLNVVADAASSGMLDQFLERNDVVHIDSKSTTEVIINEHQDEMGGSDVAKILIKASKQVSDRPEASCVSYAICHPDASGTPARDGNSVHYLSNLPKSPCFSDLLLGSSYATSPGSENSSQLSEALQNISGGQSCKVTETEEPLPTCTYCDHANQARDQPSPNVDNIGNPCSRKNSFNRTGYFSTLGDCEKALLWIYEHDKAFRENPLDIDYNLVLTRFGNLLLSAMPREGLRLVSLEPLFRETIRIAKSFIIEFSSLQLEMSKSYFTDEISECQTDSSLIYVGPLSDKVFAHHHHVKYGVQALVNNLIFSEFDTSSYCGHLLNADCWFFIIEFQRFSLLSPKDAVDPSCDSHNRNFHSLCCKKLQFFNSMCPWLTKWPDFLFKIFLRAMKYVWLAYLIIRASTDPIHLLDFKKWSPYDSSVMKVIDFDHDPAAFVNRVQFSVSPGFQLQGSVVKSEVYLIPCE